MNQQGERPRLSRRAFLRAAAGATLAASLPRVAQGGVPAAPRDLRLHSLSPVLGREDFRYLGLFRVGPDPAGARWGFSRAIMTGRRVKDEVHLFLTGSWPSGDELYEIASPESFAPVLPDAPQSRFVRNWGDIYQGRRPTANGAGSATGGLLWDDQFGGVWWTYGDSYNVAGFHDPSLGFARLDEASGATAVYGPWRTQELSQRTRGYMVRIPERFATAELNGRTLALSSQQTSGNAGSNWGPTLFAAPSLNPAATPPDTLGSNHWSFACQTVIQHDFAHKMARETNFGKCGYAYQTGAGCETASLAPGEPFLQSMDGPTCAVWIDLPDKHGVLFAGSLTWPNTVNAYPHYWYLPTRTCCHNQTDPYWASTGDGCGGMRPFWWIYDAADFVRILHGEIRAWEAQWRTRMEIYSDLSPRPAWDRVQNGYFGGAYFDRPTRRLYLSGAFEDALTNSYEPRPVIHVFQIA